MITQDLINQVQGVFKAGYDELAELQKQIDALLLKKGDIWKNKQCEMHKLIEDDIFEWACQIAEEENQHLDPEGDTQVKPYGIDVLFSTGRERTWIPVKWEKINARLANMGGDAS